MTIQGPYSGMSKENRPLVYQISALPDEAVVLKFMERGNLSADFLSATWDKTTALHRAAMKGYRSVMEKILEADPRQLDAQDNSFKTPFQWAIEMRQHEAIQFLAKKGAMLPGRGKSILIVSAAANDPEAYEM